MMEKIKPIVLLILDGLGITSEKRGNAVLAAKIPNLRKIGEYYPGTTLRASGIEAGLAWGEMGSSEVGHTNLGAGLVIYQNLSRINLAIEDKSFFSLPAWAQAIDHAEKNNSNLHIMGLLSNGGIHSDIGHLFALLEVFKNFKYKGKIFLHIFTDGQDTAPKSAGKFLEMLEKEISSSKNIRIASIIGRYYAMDKNENWERTKSAYDCLTRGIGNFAFSAKEAIESGYAKNLIDETIEPTVLKDSSGSPIGLIKDNDAVIFFNFRADRARQITRAFVFPEFRNFEREKLNSLEFISMTSYGVGYPITAVFDPQNIVNPLARVLSDSGKRQFHIAETEKYAHVTYFFNGGIEKPFSGEDRAIIPSKQVKSYDLNPEMSAYEITDRAIKEIKGLKYDFLVINLANGDMVGHTGNFKAGIRAVETLDECAGKITDAVLEADGTLIITGDHGNVEEMINLETEEIDKEHSVNPVPFWIVSEKSRRSQKSGKKIYGEPGGILADVAPTILDLMKISQPKEMTGVSLLNIISDCPLPEP